VERREEMGVDARTRTHRKIGEATDARLELAMALKTAGIQFPAMDVRRTSTHGLVVLGEISAPVARDLAAVLLRGAAAR
jgi:hypothetical protein